MERPVKQTSLMKHCSKRSSRTRVPFCQDLVEGVRVLEQLGKVGDSTNMPKRDVAVSEKTHKKMKLTLADGRC